MQLPAFLLAAAAFGAAPRVNAPPPPQPPPVKLLVTVAIDEVSWPRLEQARPLLVGGLKRILSTHFSEEVEEVLLVDEQASWPPSPAVALLIPRPHALVHWYPARGSGHGTHHDYDTHVPLIFLGAAFPRGTSSDPVTPYDLAPTLGAAVGILVPRATGKSLLPGRP